MLEKKKSPCFPCPKCFETFGFVLHFTKI